MSALMIKPKKSSNKIKNLLLIIDENNKYYEKMNHLYLLMLFVTGSSNGISSISYFAALNIQAIYDLGNIQNIFVYIRSYRVG